MKKEIRIGLVVIGGLLSLYLLIAWAKNFHFFAVNSKDYHIRFEDVAGLKAGDPVTVYGKTSGKVGRIELKADGAWVTIQLDKTIELHEDASAELMVKELMGGKRIEVRPGSAGKILSEGAKLNGSTSLDFSTAFSRFGKLVEQLESLHIDTLLHNLNSISTTFISMANDIGDGEVAALMQQTRQTLSQLNQLLGEVNRSAIVQKTAGTMEQVDSSLAIAGLALQNFNSLSSTLEKSTLPKADTLLTALNRLSGQAGQTAQEVNMLLKQMQNRSTLAGKLLYDPSVVKDLEHTLENLNQTLDHLRTKKIYVSMSLSKKQKKFSEDPVP